MGSDAGTRVGGGMGSACCWAGFDTLIIVFPEGYVRIQDVCDCACKCAKGPSGTQPAAVAAVTWTAHSARPSRISRIKHIQILCLLRLTQILFVLIHDASPVDSCVILSLSSRLPAPS